MPLRPRTIILTICVICATPFILIGVVLLGWQILQVLDEHHRPPVVVAGVVTDSQGAPAPNVTLLFDEQFRRTWTPIPFAGDARWIHSARSLQSGPDGRFSIGFRGECLYLSNVEVSAQQLHFLVHPNYTNDNREMIYTNYGVWHIQDPASITEHAKVILAK